mmetsp:Transcript_91686/g.179654  ORF Transcript_91686/g.179654 Transcript_91686/m.179654 type:complete len:213 (+) Transcript_91686:200-838(+)
MSAAPQCFHLPRRHQPPRRERRVLQPSWTSGRHSCFEPWVAARSQLLARPAELLARGWERHAPAARKEARLELIGNLHVHDGAVPEPPHEGLEALLAFAPNHLAHLARADGPSAEPVEGGADLRRQGSVHQVDEGVPEPAAAREVHGNIHEVVETREARPVEQVQDHAARVIVRKIPQHERGGLVVLFLPALTILAATACLPLCIALVLCAR